MENREIKFRVWDNVDYMSTPFTLHDLILSKVEFTSDCIVMQYTGLKDKNGKEIYQGDILKGTFPKREYKNFNNGVVIWAKVRCAFVVEINGTYKNYNDLTSCDADGTVNEETMTDYYMEVIGNIYENESLLKTI